MMQSWALLEVHDREIFRIVITFLNKRLEEQETIDWALKLKPVQRIERIALEDLLNGPSTRTLRDPWATAWRLIEESWSNGRSPGNDSIEVYRIQERLRAGDRSGALIAALVDLVAPRLRVEAIGGWRWSYVKKPRSPKTVEDILSASLISGDLVDLNVIGLSKLDDIAFLLLLANALELSIRQGLDIAHRLGWSEIQSFTRLGFLNRVYYAQFPRQDQEDGEPDAYHHGIAPSVKLLHAVVARLGDMQPSSAQTFVRRWHAEGSPVFVRLWAAMGRDSRLVPAEAVASFLRSVNDRRFWDLRTFPEIAELRSMRFSELDVQSQNHTASLLQKGPPWNLWPRKADKDKVANARQYWAVRELRRIEIAGGVLPTRVKSWMDGRLPQFPDLAYMKIDAGFPEGSSASYVPRNPDGRYDEVEGAPRLQALETALAASRSSWENDPAERANDWINESGNALKVLADLESFENGGDDFPKVWSRFGWAHRPRHPDRPATPGTNLSVEATRVLALINRLSEAASKIAIEGICAWLDAWVKQIVESPLVLPIWLRLWPLAVEITNCRPEQDDNADLIVIARTNDEDRERMDLDTLNTPAGKLIGMFLMVCPDLTKVPQAFVVGSIERRMRDIVIAADGQSGLIAKHRMIESLPYFLHTDPDWTREHLIQPLLKDDAAALALWRAVARGTRRTKVLEIIGGAMVERATDRRLGRDTRRSLVFSLVIEALHAFRKGRSPAVPNVSITQMLRTLDDEVRASAANAIQQFVHELSAKRLVESVEVEEEQGYSTDAASLFRTAAQPFLRDVWPQERSLATPGVSDALADLPATSGEAFADAVDTIARFLVPFDCWSMMDYGLYGKEGEINKLEMINDASKARALLKLLDLTVDTSEGAVIPHDITDALEQIRSVVPNIANAPEFRRLSTVARR